MTAETLERIVGRPLEEHEPSGTRVSIALMNADDACELFSELNTLRRRFDIRLNLSREYKSLLKSGRAPQSQRAA